MITIVIFNGLFTVSLLKTPDILFYYRLDTNHSHLARHIHNNFIVEKAVHY
jgi:hypothetical protein